MSKKAQPTNALSNHEVPREDSQNQQVGLVSAAARDLHPAYFAMVMATGIVSIAVHLRGWTTIALALFYTNIVAYMILWGLTLLRWLKFRRRAISDFIDHNTGPAHFTVVAGTGVLGSQIVIFGYSRLGGILIWGFTSILWLMLTYSVFTALTVKSNKPTLEHGINGSWLIAIVATQAVSVLTTLTAGLLNPSSNVLLFLSFVMWLFGGMLYIWIISLIFYRYTFFHFSPHDLTPPYWINMGAVAISTLAGADLIASAPVSPLLISMLPFLRGLSFFFWATATWWIPMLIILGIWRHSYKKFPLKYSPLYWGAVFPLGMYTVCTQRIAETTDASFLTVVPQYFIFLALLAWVVTCAGMIHDIATGAQRYIRVGRSWPQNVPASTTSGRPEISRREPEAN